MTSIIASNTPALGVKSKEGFIRSVQKNYHPHPEGPSILFSKVINASGFSPTA